MDIASRFAPAENNSPIPILIDPHGEEFSLPSFYCGQAGNITCSVLRYRFGELQKLQKYSSLIKKRK